MNRIRQALSHKATIAIAIMAVMAITAPAMSTAQESAAGEIAIAIVVHKSSGIDSLTLDELRNIFLARRQFWPDRTRITLLVRAPKSDERDFVLNSIYQMDEAQYRQYWIAKMFRAEIPRGPKIVFSGDMTLDLVTVIPGSISFIRAEEVTSDVRVLRIEGKLPADDGYPLK